MLKSAIVKLVFPYKTSTNKHKEQRESITSHTEKTIAHFQNIRIFMKKICNFYSISRTAGHLHEIDINEQGKFIQ